MRIQTGIDKERIYARPVQGSLGEICVDVMGPVACDFRRRSRQAPPHRLIIPCSGTEGLGISCRWRRHVGERESFLIPTRHFGWFADRSTMISDTTDL